VVVGSLMMDLVVRAPRLPVVGESLISDEFHTSPGGKGANQAIAAARLGAHVTIIGQLGNDRFGDILRTGLEDSGVETRYLRVDPAIGTGVAVPVVFHDGNNVIFAIPQANLGLGAEAIEAARPAIESADMLLVQFEVNMEATLAAVRIAHAAGVPVMLNPGPAVAHPPDLVNLASIIVPNEIEAAALVPGAKGNHLLEMATLRRVVPACVVTLGEAGAAFDDGAGPTFAGAFPVNPIDSVGAGDAFCGGLAVALCEGRPLSEAVRFANAAGALATTKAGAQAAMPVRAEVDVLVGGSGGTFRSLSASHGEHGERRTNSEHSPGLAH
jgi:ribokinase